MIDKKIAADLGDIHYGFLADDSLGIACQMIGEAVLEKNLKKAMLGVALLTAPGASDD